MAENDRQTDRMTPRGSQDRGHDEAPQDQNGLISARTATSSALPHAHIHTYRYTRFIQF